MGECEDGELSTVDYPPVFRGSLTGVISEADKEEDVILTLQTEETDSPILYELQSNPHSYFSLHPTSGDLSLARQPRITELSGSVIVLEVLATQLKGKMIDNWPRIEDIHSDVNSSSTAEVNIILRDRLDSSGSTTLPEEGGCLCGQKKNIVQVRLFS